MIDHRLSTRKYKILSTYPSAFSGSDIQIPELDMPQPCCDKICAVGRERKGIDLCGHLVTRDLGACFPVPYMNISVVLGYRKREATHQHVDSGDASC